MTTEWIEHDGKSRPNLPVGTLVSVRLANGWTDENFLKGSFPNWEWWDGTEYSDSSWTRGGDFGIVAYRVVTK